MSLGLPIRLAIDAMSGDLGHPVAVAAARLFLQTEPDVHLVLVGDQGLLTSALGSRSADPRLSIHHAPEVVAMNDLPALALRRKKNSSMRVAINLVQRGEAEAAISAGNTGALMATARFVLKTLPGIDRPAFIALVPSVRGRPVHMLDLGANAACSGEQLFQFALMGSALITATSGIESPRVALLNVGEEESKGHGAIQEAARRLKGSGLNYVGFVEGDGVFLDDIDLVVCDGFVGNVALKSSEGVAKLIKHFMAEEFRRNWLTRAAALAAAPVLNALRRRMDPRQYNGASLIGLRATVVKSHGGSDASAFVQALRVAKREVESQVPARIGALIQAQV